MVEKRRRPPRKTPTHDPLAWVENVKKDNLNDEQSKTTSEGNKIMTQEKNNDEYQLLDSLSTCIQIADADFNIRYLNKALQEMFAEVESDIRKELPQFDKNNLIGMNMDFFHKNPSHQRAMMRDFKSKISSNIKIGGRHFLLTATPVFNHAGERQNIMVEWVDITAWSSITYVLTEASKGNLNAQLIDESLTSVDTKKLHNVTATLCQNIRNLVTDANMLSVAAVEGRLATRADANKHQGDFRKIVEGVNDTLDAVIEPLNNIADVIDAIGNNDLSMNLKGTYQGDFLRIKEALDTALNALNSSLYQIVDTVDQVSQSADQLSSASHNMAATSEQQSSAVEEVTSAIEETDSQVRANTDNANAANQLVISTSQAASQGQQKMQAMSEAMNAINDSSQSIAKIIKVIDEIAFQTNLLALNAAVEAARAGQHGRGFAVVAQEVRNLAGRSAKAARETADLIENSTKRVKDGVNIAGETREALDQIVTNVIKVKDLVAEIATASVEQSRGVSQINVAMGQVASAARSGSKQAEELSSASTQLTSIANQTQHELGRFKLCERQSSANAGLLSLDGITPELLKQLQMLLSQQNSSTPVKTVAKSNTAPVAKKSPKQIMPLDQDERGFGKF